MSKQQMMQQQQMRRDPSELDMNGQRPRTPSSGDNAPSPSKRPRMEGHPSMMMQNGGPQQMMDQANNSPNALLMQGGVPPTALTDAQYMAFQQRPIQVQQKSIDVFNQNLKNNQQRANLSKPGMPGQGSPMMQPGMDLSSVGADYFNANMQMRQGMPNGNGTANGGNHALQDYQMQLMLLEQQNKKRLLMARQEQEDPRGPQGAGGIPGGPGFAGPQGMSPSGSRSGPSPGPNDQVKRGTPKMAQTGLPGSPMPDGSMPQARGSPATSMSHGNGMQNEMFQMKSMNEGMTVMGPNGNMMRQPPSSHPNYNAHFTPQQIAEIQQRRGMPNGNWPQGQPPMMQQQPPPQPQQPAPMGTPQQRGGNMPPPNAPAGAAVNGRPGSPSQPAAPPTPSQANKANPKGKKDAKDRKKPTKKNSTAGTVTTATPASEAENPPPTPTPSTPITPVHPNSFNGQKAEAQGQVAVPANPATTAPAVEQPPSDAASMEAYLEGSDIQGAFDMTFGTFDNPNHLEGFDFDSFLQDNILEGEHFPFDAGTEAVGGG
ncbi:MAG: hypothetical protein Q9220_002568 [cf. Caloplaca sp. 1 TL-2023]